METRERMGSPEAVVIYFGSMTDHLPKVSPINRSQSQSFCLVKQREVAERDKTKRLYGRLIPYRFSRLLCRHERCLPAKKLEKHCVTKQRFAAQDKHADITIQKLDTVIIV